MYVFISQQINRRRVLKISFIFRKIIVQLGCTLLIINYFINELSNSGNYIAFLIIQKIIGIYKFYSILL